MRKTTPLILPLTVGICFVMSAKDPGQAFVAATKSLVDQKNWPELEALARQYIKGSPKDSKGWEVLGLSISNQNRAKESLEAFETAFRLDRYSFTAAMNLGLAYARTQKTKELVDLIDSLQLRQQETAFQLMDHDEISRSLDGENLAPLAPERKANASFPELGPYPAGRQGRITNFGSYHGGSVLFEVIVAPDGTVARCKPLSGLAVFVGASKGLIEKVKFPPIESADPQLPQRCKIAVVFDRGLDDADENKRLKVHRMGIGFSGAEASRKAVDVPVTPDTPLIRR